MKKNNWKKCMSLMLAGVMALSVTACGGGGSSEGGNTGASGGSAVSTTIDKNLIYKETPIDLSSLQMTIDNAGEAVCVGDRLYLPVYSYENGMQMKIVSMNMEGGDLKSYTCGETAQENINYSTPAFDKEGNAYAIKTDYGMMPEYSGEEIMPADGAKEGEEAATETEAASGASSEAASETGATQATASETTATEEEPAGAFATAETGEGGDMEQVENIFSLVKFDAEGKTLFEAKLNKTDFAKENDELWFQSCRYLEDEGILLQTGYGFFLCSAEDGSFTRKVYESNPEDYSEFFFSGSGKVYMVTFGGGPGMSLKELDLKTGQTGEEYALPGDMNGFGSGMLKPGTTCDFLIQNNDCISAWNIGDEKSTKLISFVDSDITMEYMNSILQMSDDKFFVNYSATTPDGDYSTISAFLDKVNPEDVVEKKVLTIGVMNVDTKFRNVIVNFNKANENYRIKIVDYSQYNTDNDWQAGYLKFNADLVSGNAPDMMYLNMGQSIQSFEAKGILEPLDEYLANDPEISKKEYVTKVLDVYKYKGTTYTIVPSFSAYTYSMKKSVADKITDWNLRTLDQMIKDQGLEYATAFGFPMSNAQFLQLTLMFDSTSFMDWNEDKAKFNSEEFIELLKFCKNFPDNVDEYYNDDSWQEFEVAFRKDKALVNQTSIYRFKDFARLKYVTFGEDVSFVGFPRLEGAGGAAAAATYLLAMNSHASDKDACWEFMRTFYLDDFQNSIAKEGWELPIAKAQLDEQAKAAMERPYYMDNGKKVEYDDTEFIDGQEIKLPPLSQEDVDQLYEYLNNIDTAITYDEKVYNIIMEEAAPFFKGQKTAEDCAAIIQSKVQLYMDENS